MESNNEKYFQFPLFLMRELITDNVNMINNILCYGLYKCSKSINYEDKKAIELGYSHGVYKNVARQLIYTYIRHKSELTAYLKKTIDKYINADKLDLDMDRDGFNLKFDAIYNKRQKYINGKYYWEYIQDSKNRKQKTHLKYQEFQPDDEIGCLIELFLKDKEFKERAIEFYQIHCAYNIIGVNGGKGYAIEKGKEIESRTPDGEPMPMVKKELLFEFKNTDKTEFELVQFACYIAIKSILGKKAYCRTTQQHIISRMLGYSSIKTMPTPDKLQPQIKELYDKYSKRHHIKKLLQELELKWHIITYSNHIRGLYIADKKKISIDKLVMIAEEKKKKNQINMLKKQKDEARLKALEMLNNNNKYYNKITSIT